MSEKKDGWKVDKHISYGSLLITASMALTMIVFAVRLEGRVDLNVTGINHNKAEISRVEKEQESQYKEIIRLLERLSDKLDQKADK